MDARDYQIEIANKGIEILSKFGIVYLSMEERTGKTIPAIMIADKCIAKGKKVLVLTTKNALPGWHNTLDNFYHTSEFYVINYHKAKNVTFKPDLIILDEAHNYISSFPKTSGIHNSIKAFSKNIPIIYSSATPHPQGLMQLFHQFSLSSYSPWSEYKNYYKWYNDYAERNDKGEFAIIRISPVQTAIDYTRVQHNVIRQEVKHLFLSMTRAECGFEKEPEDILHYITPSDKFKELYNHILKHKSLSFYHEETNREYDLICDTPGKLKYALHMLEGGVLKVDVKEKNKKTEENYLVLNTSEKIAYILKTWGDTSDMVIMYHYKGEGEKLRKWFSNALILQATTNAEGIDLYQYKHLIIYSQDFRTGKHTQRRARQANKLREEDIKVHYLLIKKAISEQVYVTCSLNKRNFVDTLFERKTI